MNKLLQRIGVSTAVMGLAVTPVGLVSANSNIDTTGPDSNNQIELRSEAEHLVTNDNNLAATNNNPQDASSGNARVSHNTDGGSAKSGNASNTSKLSVTANIDNGTAAKSAFSGAGGGLGDVDASIKKTGPDSNNTIEVTHESRVEVNNNNNIAITNNNTQTATSGNARVSGNTEGGNATSGNAENNSSATVNLTVRN